MVPNWKYLTTNEVCELVGRGRTWLWRQISDGKFPQPDRFGASVRFRSDVVCKAMEDMSAKAKEQRAISEAVIKSVSARGVAKRQSIRGAIRQGGTV